MFYIKRKTTKLNTTRTSVLDENHNVIYEGPEIITKSIVEVEYYFKMVYDINTYTTFIESFEGKYLFSTEEEANIELSLISKDPRFNVGSIGSEVSFSVVEI